MKIEKRTTHQAMMIQITYQVDISTAIHFNIFDEIDGSNNSKKKKNVNDNNTATTSKINGMNSLLGSN